jgi:hypothetical protein
VVYAVQQGFDVAQIVPYDANTERLDLADQETVVVDVVALQEHCLPGKFVDAEAGASTQVEVPEEAGKPLDVGVSSEAAALLKTAELLQPVDAPTTEKYDGFDPELDVGRPQEWQVQRWIEEE